MSPKTVKKQIASLLQSKPLNHWHLAVKWLGEITKCETQKALYKNERKTQSESLNNSAGFQGCTLHLAQGKDLFAVSHFTVYGLQLLKK